MRSVFYVLSALAVMGLAYWAYRENYRNQQSVKDVAELRREIGQLHEALSVQRAEWAYLNRPDRLRDLADLNFDSLGLLPLAPEQFAHLREVAYPLPPLLPIDNPIDVIGDLETVQ